STPPASVALLDRCQLLKQRARRDPGLALDPERLLSLRSTPPASVALLDRCQLLKQRARRDPGLALNSERLLSLRSTPSASVALLRLKARDCTPPRQTQTR